MGDNMSLKILINSHLAFFPENLGAVSDEHGDRFHIDISVIDHSIRVDGVQQCWLTIAGCFSAIRQMLNTDASLHPRNLNQINVKLINIMLYLCML